MTRRTFDVEVVQAQDLVRGDVIGLDAGHPLGRQSTKLLSPYPHSKWVKVEDVDVDDGDASTLRVLALGNAYKVGPLDLVYVQRPSGKMPKPHRIKAEKAALEGRTP